MGRMHHLGVTLRSEAVSLIEGRRSHRLSFSIPHVLGTPLDPVHCQA